MLAPQVETNHYATMPTVAKADWWPGYAATTLRRWYMEVFLCRVESSKSLQYIVLTETI